MQQNLAPNRSRFPVTLPLKQSALKLPPTHTASKEPPASSTPSDLQPLPFPPPRRPQKASSSGGTSDLSLILSYCFSNPPSANLANNRHVSPQLIPYLPPPEPKLFPACPAVQIVRSASRPSTKSSHRTPASSLSSLSRRSKGEKGKSGSTSPHRDRPTTHLPARRSSTSSLSQPPLSNLTGLPPVKKKRRTSSVESTRTTIRFGGQPEHPLVAVSLGTTTTMTPRPTKRKRKSMSTAGFTRPSHPDPQPICSDERAATAAAAPSRALSNPPVEPTLSPLQTSTSALPPFPPQALAAPKIAVPTTLSSAAQRSLITLHEVAQGRVDRLGAQSSCGAVRV